MTDLFLAESRLVNPSLYLYWVQVQSNHNLNRQHVFKSVQDFILSLPPRYALGAESLSEVLIHMRLMAAVRADPGRGRPSVHIANLDEDVQSMSDVSYNNNNNMLLIIFDTTSSRFDDSSRQ